jgi:uncharacterized membrane protein HdeD (DUF308 family)
MVSYLARNWWLPVLGGVSAVLFGIVALAWPGITFESLVLVFGAFAFVDGLCALALGLWAAGADEDWWPLVLAGIVGIAIGVLTFTRPAAMALALVYVVGMWAMVTGLLEIVAAVQLRKFISTEWLMALGGIVSIVFGVLVLAQPATAAIALTALFGFYAILAGISEVGLGIRMRSLAEAAPVRTQHAPEAAR